MDRNIDSPGAILVRDGKIASIFLGESGERFFSTFKLGTSTEAYDAEGKVVMPSFVDLHAHFRDPGYTRKESLETGSKAAAAGGYGTVVLMANTKPVVSDALGAREIRERADTIGLINIFQAVSLTRDFDGKDTTALGELDSAQVPLVTEDGREVASAAVMLQAMETCAHRGLLVSCHCEDPDLAAVAKQFREVALRTIIGGSLSGVEFDPSARFSSLSGSTEFEPVRANLASAERMLRLAENIMTERNLALASSAGCRVHIAHVSTIEVIESVRKAKTERPNHVTCEVTPHHLGLTSLVPAIVNPPLRSESDRLALIEALLDGTIDAIATDHAPHTEADKAEGAPGFSGIETAFAFCHTILVKTGRMSLSALSSLMSAKPAELLAVKRGLFRVGYDADFVFVDQDLRWTVNPRDKDRWFSRGLNTPIDGETLTGCVLATFKAGVRVYRRN